MQTEVLPPVRVSTKLVQDLDSLVTEGYYGSRSEAIRDALRLLIRLQRGMLVSTKTSVELGREARDALWKKALEEAGGDKEKAADILLKRYA